MKKQERATISTKKYCGVIYTIKNVVTNKIYLGSTKKPALREKQHFQSLENNKHHSKYLQNSFNKHGKDVFKFEIIYYIIASDILSIEQQYLDNMDWSMSYNISPRATGGPPNLDQHPLGEEIRQRLSRSSQARYAALTKSERSAVYKTGKDHWGYGVLPASSRPVSCLGSTYPAISHAAKALNISPCVVRNRCLTDDIKFKDWYFVGCKPQTKDLVFKVSKRLRPVSCLGVCFASIAEASRHLESNAETLRSRVLSKNYPTYYYLTESNANDTGKLVTTHKNKVSCEGHIFLTLADAARYFDLTGKAVAYRIKSKFFPLYFKLY